MNKPTPHPLFTRGDNRGLTFIEVLDEECVECYPANGGAKLGVVARTDNSETVHCTQCDHMTTRRLRPEDEEFRPMNSRMLKPRATAAPAPAQQEAQEARDSMSPPPADWLTSL